MNPKKEKPIEQKVKINKYVDFNFEESEKLDKKISIIKNKFDFTHFKTFYGKLDNLLQFNEFINKLKESVFAKGTSNEEREEKTNFLDNFLNFYKKEFNAEFFEKFNLIYLFKSVPMRWGKYVLDSVNVENNNIYLNIVNYRAISFELEHGFPITAAKAAFDEPLSYFVIIPKINNTESVNANYIYNIEKYKKYRDKNPAGIIFKSENQVIESEFIEME
ncbi:hypothetical protein ACW95P_03260 [Candidatus Mycoplasma pogonae]